MTSNDGNGAGREERLNAALASWLEAAERGDAPDAQEFLGRHAEFADELAKHLANWNRFPRVIAAVKDAAPPAPADTPTGLVDTHDPAAGPPADGDLPSFGDYEVLEEIGRGGMGVVYKARQKSLNRLVALKRVRSADSAADVQRFRSEAEMAALLDHPHIVPVYEVGQHDSRTYFSMKLIDGGSLAAQLGRYAADPRSAVPLLVAAARAVHHAHQRGILHRDLKPANILLDAHGRPYVSDFGLAKRVETDSGLTQSGAIIGTPSYMAPEQAAGQKGLSTAADVYGLGAILYELLAGRPPFRAATPLETLRQVVECEPVWPRALNPRVDRDLETVCLKCLEKEPSRRYGSAEALAGELERWLKGEPIRARPASRRERVVKWVRRRPGLAGMWATLGLVVVAAFCLISWKWGEAVEQKGIADDNAQDARQHAQDARRHAQDALQAEKHARKQQRIAEHSADALRESLHETERALANSRVTQAYRTLLGNEPWLTQGQLEECPRDFRFWEWHYIQRLCTNEQFALPGHTDSLFGVTLISPDMRMVAFGGTSGVLQVWDARIGRDPCLFRTYNGAVAGLCFSPDSRWLALATVDGQQSPLFARPGGDRMVRVLEMPTGRNIRSWPWATSTANVCVSPDGRRLAVSGGDMGGPGRLTVWDVATGREVFTIKAKPIPGRNTRAFRCMAFSPDGQRLATGSGGQYAGKVELWQARSGRNLGSLNGFKQAVDCVCFSPDGLRLASGTGLSDTSDRRWSTGGSGEVQVWDVRTGQAVLTLQGPTHRIISLGFSPDGRHLAATDPALHLWDSHTGKELYRFRAADSVGVQFSPDGRRLIQGVHGRILIWDARSGQEGRLVKGSRSPVHSVCFSPDNRRIATGSGDVGGPGELNVLDTRTGQTIFSIERPSLVSCVCFSPDGRLFASSTQRDFPWLPLLSKGVPPELNIWDARTGKELLSLKGHIRSVSAMCFSPGGKRLASAGGGNVNVWDSRTGQKLLSFHGDGSFASVCFSPDGKHLAAGSEKRARVWDLATGQQLFALDVKASAIWFSPDGKRLFAADSQDFRVWDARNGKTLVTLPLHGSSDKVAHSPDGQRLAASGTDGDDVWVRLWDARNGQQLLTLPGDTGLLRDLTFSPDGNLLASANLYGQVRIWDARDVPQVLRLKTGEAGLRFTVAFSPDGKLLASAGERAVEVYDWRRRQRLFAFKHTSTVFGPCDFSPDGRLLASTGSDNKVRVWDMPTGRERLTLTLGAGHGGWGLAFSSDGKRLSACFLGLRPDQPGWMTKTWDLATGKDTARAAGPVIWKMPGACVVSPDGRHFARGTGEPIEITELNPSEEKRAWQALYAPPDMDWHLQEANAALRADHWFAVVFHLNLALTVRPADPNLLWCRGRARAELGEYAQVARDFQRVVQKVPDWPDGWRALCLAELGAGREDAYRRTRARLPWRASRPPDAAPAVSLRGLMPGNGPAAAVLGAVAQISWQRAQPAAVAWRVSVLRPGKVPDPQQVLPKLGPASAITKAGILYRAGRYADAVAAARAEPHALACLYRAMAECARARPAKAKEALAQADKWLAAPQADNPEKTNAAGLTWDFRLEVDLLRAEAEALLGTKGRNRSPALGPGG